MKPATMLPPAVIGRYRTKGVLGTGTFATVVLAEDEALETTVAIKVLAENWSLDADVRARFVREARMLRRIESPRLIRVHDIGDLDQRPYFVMDHAPGGTLADRLDLLREDGGLPVAPDVALRLAAELAACVGAAHSFGLVHRDVKPTNLLIRPALTPGQDPMPGGASRLLAADEELVLTDFGLARDMAAGSALSIGAGTQPYMAPEQTDLAVTVDERTDLYACTVILTIALTGAGSTLVADPDRRAALLAALDPPIARALEGGLAADRDRRPHSSDEWLHSMQSALGISPVIAATTTATTPPRGGLPRWLATLRRRPMIGRDPALEGFRVMWDRARSGERCAVVYKGEAGIGKSRLLAEIASQTVSRGGVVLAGRSDDGASLPYGALAHALRPLLTDDRALDDMLVDVGPAAGHLALVLPELATRVEPPAVHSHPESSRALLLHAIDRLLGVAGDGVPLVLIVDDLHAADRSTLDALRYLMRSDEEQPLLLVAAYRDTEIEADHPIAELYEELRRHDRVIRTSLAGLDLDELIELIAQRDMAPASPEVLHALQRQTGGNPFFVEEILSGLEEEALDLSREIEHLPDGTLDVVRARLRRLPDHAQRALVIAAVIGHGFDRRTVELVGGPEALGGLDTAVSSGFVERSDGGFAFRHGLVRAALLHDLDHPQEAELHWRTGEALERIHAADLDEHVAEIAHHLRLGVSAGDARKAGAYLERAGARQFHTVALDEAVASLSAALALLPDATTSDQLCRMRILELLAETHFWRADPDAMRAAALAAAAVAEASGTAEDLARNAVVAARWNRGGELDQTVLGLLERAGARLPPGDSALRSQVLAMHAYALQGAGRGLDARTVAEDAYAMARRCDDLDSLSMALLVRTYTESGTPSVHETRSVVSALEDVAARLQRDDRRRQYAVFALRARAYVQVVAGDLAGFSATRAEFTALADRMRATYWRSQALQWDAAIALAQGRFADALAMTEEALAIWDRRAAAFRVYSVQLAVAGLERGEHERVLPEIERLVAGENNSTGYAWRAVLAAGLTAIGRSDEARSQLEDLGADGFARLADDLQRPHALRWLAETVASVGATDLAEALLPIIEPYAAQVLVGPALTTVEGSADRAVGQVLATLGRHDEAEAHYRRAVELEGRLGFTALEARTRAWWARAVHDRGAPGDADRARLLAADAAARADRLGMPLLAASVRELEDRLHTS